MTAPQSATLAINVVNWLNSVERDFSQAFTAARVWYPRFDLETVDTLQVLVIPSVRTMSVESRGTDQLNIGIRILFYRSIDPADVTSMDEMALLMEEVQDSMNRQTFSMGGQLVAAFTSQEIDYAEEEMPSLLAWLGVLRVEFVLLQPNPGLMASRMMARNNAS